MIILDYRDPRPLYEQIVDKLEQLILKGGLTENDKLPSVRNLAVELSINPNTIQRAYAELERKGLIYTVKGRGNFVAPYETLKAVKLQKALAAFDAAAADALDLGISPDELRNRIG